MDDPQLPAEQPPKPLQIAQRVLEEIQLAPRVTMDSWRDEVTAVSRAAAAHGAFKESLQGYEMVGKSLGVNGLSEQHTSQHVHIHDADVAKEQSTDDLLARLEFLRSRPTPATPDPVDATPEAEAYDPEDDMFS